MTHQHANYKQLRALRRTGAFQGNNHATMPSKWLIIAFIGTIAPLMVALLVFGYCHMVVIIAKGTL